MHGFISSWQVYEAVGEKELTQATVVTEFINQYTGDDVEEVFGSDSEHDFVRKVI